MLKFIEDNWGVAPLGTRDARANNFLSAFDFRAPGAAARARGRVRHADLGSRPDGEASSTRPTERRWSQPSGAIGFAIARDRKRSRTAA